METGQSFALSQHPEIVNLLSVLEEAKLTKERREVESLVKYLDNMENQFGQIVQELQQIQTQLEQIQDRGVKTSVTHVVSGIEGKVRQVGSQIAIIKKNMVDSARQAVVQMKEKGIGALQSAVQTMKIPSALRHIQKGLHICTEEMGKGAEKIGIMGEELHKAAEHSQNARRILFGKPERESTPRNTEKGVLSRIEKVLYSCGKVFSDMEKSTEKTLRKMEQFGREEEKKSSVKMELQKLKEGNKNPPAILPKDRKKER